MRPYKSRSGKTSGVIGYSAGKEHIVVVFSNGGRYTYTYASAGRNHVEQMKELAQQQSGLSTYIAQHQPGYE